MACNPPLFDPACPDEWWDHAKARRICGTHMRDHCIIKPLLPLHFMEILLYCITQFFLLYISLLTVQSKDPAIRRVTKTIVYTFLSNLYFKKL
jgi:hypothetical protein